MTLTELSMTEWDDIEAVTTKKGKRYEGEFFLSKHGYLTAETKDGDVRIPISDIDYTDHR